MRESRSRPPFGRRRLGLPGLNELFPPEFDAADLELQIADQIRSRAMRLRRAAEQVRAENPGRDAAALVERLFEPYIQRAVTVGAGGVALGALPLSFLWEGRARRHQTRSLLGRQLELVAVALLLGRDLAPDELAAEVIDVLDEVYGLERIRGDLRRRSALEQVPDQGARAVAKIAVQRVLGVVGTARDAADLYRDYARFAELRAAVTRRLPTGGEGRRPRR